MKKYLWILLATVSVASLVGCADEPKAQPAPSTTTTTTYSHSSYDK